MIAFCTAFDSVSRTTRSNGIELRELALAGEPEPDDEKHVDDERSNDLLGDRQAEEEHVVKELRIHGANANAGSGNLFPATTSPRPSLAYEFLALGGVLLAGVVFAAACGRCARRLRIRGRSRSTAHAPA